MCGGEVFLIEGRECQVVCLCVLRICFRTVIYLPCFYLGQWEKTGNYLFWQRFSYAWKRNTDLTCYIITLKPPLGSSPSPVCQSALCMSGHGLYRNSYFMKQGGEVLWDRAEYNCEVGVLWDSPKEEGSFVLILVPWFCIFVVFFVFFVFFALLEEHLRHMELPD